MKLAIQNGSSAWLIDLPEDVEIKKECPECNGEGEVWKQGFCAKPMSDCCGGCGDDVPCEECEGTGYVLAEDDLPTGSVTIEFTEDFF